MRGGRGTTLGLLCGAILAAAILVGRSGAVSGAVVGLVIGVAYAVSLWGGLRRMSRLEPSAALRVMQLGSLLRFVLMVAGFALVARLLPGVNLAWAAAALFVPVAWSLVTAAREGARMS